MYIMVYLDFMYNSGVYCLSMLWSFCCGKSKKLPLFLSVFFNNVWKFILYKYLVFIAHLLLKQTKQRLNSIISVSADWRKLNPISPVHRLFAQLSVQMLEVLHSSKIVTIVITKWWRFKSHELKCLKISTSFSGC